MRFLKPELAVVDIAKLRDYCLSATHSQGKFKARVFMAALGITAADALILRNWLLSAVASCDITSGTKDLYGDRFTLDFPVQHKSRSARIRSAWIVRKGEDFPRLITCYVL